MKKAKIIRGWAIIKDGKIVKDTGNHLHPLFVFNRAYLAHGAVWKPKEKVVKVEIHIQP